MDSSSSSSPFDELINDPEYHDYLAIVKGLRNGLVYGVKIRFPHALLMSILFGRGDWKTRARVIFKLTAQHAMGLAKFVTVYKTLLLVQKRLHGGKQNSADTFFAGLVGGYVVFGDRTAINEQIVLYVVSRVVASFIPRDSTVKSPPGKAVPPNARHFSIFAALAWGAVMWIFQERGETIQPGMLSSMNFLYRDSEKWNGLRTLLWKNK